MTDNRQPVLEVNGLTGGYSMVKPVIHVLKFAIQPGQMVGLIGLNGAGKSTTMKHLLGLMKAHSGDIRIKGRTMSEAPEQYRSAFAFVPESPLLYEELTVAEHLELTALAYGLTRQEYEGRVSTLLEQFQMQDKQQQHTAHLSKGMKQKMMIMSAFLVRPDLYIIDEPFLGLDPLGIRSLLELMVNMKQTGASLLISSHILSTIQNYCDRFIVLHQGRILVEGPLSAVQEASGLTDSHSLEDMFYALVKGGS